MRLDGLLVLELWDLIVSVLGNMTQTTERPGRPVIIDKNPDILWSVNKLARSITKWTKAWPGRWGHQGVLLTGGGGLARVPDVRVCKHLWSMGGTHRVIRMNDHSAENKFERFREVFGIYEQIRIRILSSRKLFFERFEFFGVFKVQSHTMWPYMCMSCGLFAPTQFHFECCGVRDDS